MANNESTSRVRSRGIAAVVLLALVTLALRFASSSEKLDGDAPSNAGGLRARRLDLRTWLRKEYAVPEETLARYPTIVDRAYNGIKGIGKAPLETDLFDERMKDLIMKRTLERDILPANPYLDAIPVRTNLELVTDPRYTPGTPEFDETLAEKTDRRVVAAQEKFENKFLKDIIGDWFASPDSGSAGSATEIALLNRPHKNQRGNLYGT